MAEYVTTYNPKCRVTFKSPVDGTDIIDSEIITDDLISISTNKAYGRPAGTWQLLLPYRQINHNGKWLRYHEIIKNGDAVTIEMYHNGTWYMVMMGVVDRTSSTRSGGAQPLRQVKISGQDAGKLLQSDIGWDINGTKVEIPKQGPVMMETITDNFIKRIALTRGTPNTLLEKIFEVFLDSNNHYLSTFFDFQGSDGKQWWLAKPEMLGITGTSIWEAMVQCSDMPWNMLHADTVGPRQFLVYLEQFPVDSNGHLNMGDDRKFLVEDEEIVQDDLGASDAERVNLVCYWPELAQMQTNGLLELALADKRLTEFSKESIGLHGYKPKIIKSTFTPVEIESPVEQWDQFTSNKDMDGETTIEAMIERKKYFWSWYRNNHELDSGPIVLHGRPDIRTGCCLFVKQDKVREFLVEQVSHQINFGQQTQFLTTLHVTRGQEYTGKLPLPKPQSPTKKPLDPPPMPNPAPVTTFV